LLYTFEGISRLVWELRGIVDLQNNWALRVEQAEYYVLDHKLNSDEETGRVTSGIPEELKPPTDGEVQIVKIKGNTDNTVPLLEIDRNWRIYLMCFILHCSLHGSHCGRLSISPCSR
jgi:hypothetical protein